MMRNLTIRVAYVYLLTQDNATCHVARNILVDN